MDIRPILEQVRSGRALSAAQMRDVMTRLMQGEYSESEMGDFLTVLAQKGVTAVELSSAAKVLRQFALPIAVSHDRLLDTCGTGGDGLGTPNISTVSALVSAAAGCWVAKHGNRAVTGRCGSADLLEALGVAIDLEPAAALRCLDEARIMFLWAPRYHPAMKVVGPVRKRLGIRTIFNLLGPLVNPAGVRRQLIGVYDSKLVPLFADVLADLGVDHAFVVHGADGMDEVSISGPTEVAEIQDGRIRVFTFQPEQVGISIQPVPAATGIGEATPEAASAAQWARSMMTGQMPGPYEDLVCVNSAFALVAAGQARDLAEGFQTARRLVKSGAALETLDRLRQASHAKP